MRYVEATRAIADRLAARVGPVVLVVPPTEHAAVAQALASHWAGAARGDLAAALVATERRVIVEGLPADLASLRSSLGDLNDLREVTKARGATLALLLSLRELRAFEENAPDVASVARGHDELEFEPADVDDATARAALGVWLDATVARLDLRGFFRAESEDVSFRVTDVYECLDVLDESGRGSVRADEAVAAHPPQTVLLGQPGSGKTFFLRWLALEAHRRPTFMGAEGAWPVLVSLPAVDGAFGQRPLLRMIESLLLEQAPVAAHGFRRAREQGRVIYLFDGLDEVGDIAARQSAAWEIQALVASGAPVVVTSRVAGYDEAPLAALRTLTLVALSDDSIGALLERWMRLYFAQSRGPAAAERGAAEGHKLAADVLANPQLRALAGSPLLLTVLAVIHRAGVRIPDQRADLYAHITQVLVERWNQVRSAAGTPGPVIKAVDAVRLLGPVALDLIRHGGRGAVSETRLRGLLAAGLAAGNIRGIGSADQAIDVFKRSLGLLVEQAPGWFAFLHLTFVEYFAARELIRSGELEALVQDRRRAFLPEWTEVILLAAGELGIVRADDQRLSAMVQALIEGARRRRGQPSATVPAVLGGLLADDPGLDDASGQALVRALIPVFWFDRAYVNPVDVVREAIRLATRIMAGRFREVLVARARAAFERERPMQALIRNTWSQPFVDSFVWLLLWMDVDDSYFLEAWADTPWSSSREKRVTLAGPGDKASAVFVSSRLAARAAAGLNRWALRARTTLDEPWQSVRLSDLAIPDTSRIHTVVDLPTDRRAIAVELFCPPARNT